MVLVIFSLAIFGATKVQFTKDYTIGGGSYKVGDVVLLSDDNAQAAITSQAATTVITPRANAITTVTEDYTVVVDDSILICNASNGAIAITLPAAADAESLYYTFKKIDSGTNAITLTADGGTITLDAQYDVVTIFSSGKGIFKAGSPKSVKFLLLFSVPEAFFANLIISPKA